jgi:microsomal dipeptidase-like Zn-dependent dipeptidase
MTPRRGRYPVEARLFQTIRMLRAVKAAAVVVAIAALGWAPGASGAPLANHCFRLNSASTAHSFGRFYVKPTGHGVLLYDRRRRLLSVGSGNTTARTAAPGPAGEWALRRSGKSFVLRSTSNGRVLAVSGRSLVTVPAGGHARARLFRLTAARGCRMFPEANVGATGKPFRKLFGFADAHLHVTAMLRAGGLVISGENFNRFGVSEALGHDADVHGQDGSEDFTGNLLRNGTPTGTHDTHGWPSFAGWPTFDTYTHQQIYYRWLQRAWMAGERLVVAQTVEDESICNIEPRKSHSCNETQTVEAEVNQLKALQAYIDAQSGGRGRGWFRLVYGPRAARSAIESGKLAVLIGVESSNPFGCSETQGQPNCNRADIDSGIARLRKIGVRTMFVAHWTDNALAGAALEGGDKGTFIAALQIEQTGHPFSTGPCPHPEQGEVVGPPAPLPGVSQSVSGAPPVTAAGDSGQRQCNTRGLTDLGEYAIRRLMDNHMLIEVDHLSEYARDRVLQIAAARHYPLVSSHTNTGGRWVPEELQQLYKLGGFATARIDDAPALRTALLSFKRYGATGVGLGSDTGGFNALPGPAADAAKHPLRYPFRAFDRRVRFSRERTGTRAFDVNKYGVAHYGLLPDLLANVARQPRGNRALSALFGSAAAYLRTWRLTGPAG